MKIIQDFSHTIRFISIVPFGVFQEHLCPLYDLPSYRFLEDNLHLSALAEPALDSAPLPALVNAHLLADEVLEVGLLIEEVPDDDRVGVDYAIDCPYFVFLLEQFEPALVVLLVHQHLDRPVESYAAGLVVVVDVRLVTDHLEAQVREEVLLEGYHCKYLCLIAVLGLGYHLLADLADRQVALLGVQHLLLAIEQPQLPFHCLVARHYVESRLVLDRPLEESHQVQVDHALPRPLQVARSACDPSLHEVRLEMVHQHGDAVPLPRHLHWLSEHLHRLDLAFLLDLAQLNLLSRFDPALYDGASDDSPLPFDLEAVIDKVEEPAVLLPVGNRYLLEEHLLQSVVVQLRFVFGRKGHHHDVLPEFSLGEHLPEGSHLGLEDLFVLDQVDFVQHHHDLLHKEFSDDDALCSLGLDALGGVNHQEHDVYYLGSPDNGLYEGGMARAVDKRELQVLLFNFSLEPDGHSGEEGREAKIEGDSPFLGLGVLIQAGSGSNLAQDPADGRFAGVHMSEHSYVDIDAFVGQYILNFLFAQVQKIFLHTLLYSIKITRQIQSIQQKGKKNR